VVESAVEPAAESTAEPVVESAVEPAAESTAEPVVEPAAEPAVESAVEPAAPEEVLALPPEEGATPEFSSGEENVSFLPEGEVPPEPQDVL
jgi:hypothetical protein